MHTLDHIKALIARTLVPTTTHIPAQLGHIALLPHQRSAAAQLLHTLCRYHGALLADPVGTGKTYTALAVARHYAAVTIIAPAVLRTMWAEALRDTGVTATLRSTESLSRTSKTAPLSSSSLVIVDEAHHFRNDATRRYDALARLICGHDALLLTATPIHNTRNDLRALLSLFLSLPPNEIPSQLLARVAVRQTHSTTTRLPHVDAISWFDTPSHPAVLKAILELPPPLPPLDGGTAHALSRLGLLRLWTSSDAALLSAIARRLATGHAMQAQLAHGALPTRRDLRRWIADTSTLQLGFAFAPPSAVAAPAMLAHLDAHMEGLRALRATLTQHPADDLRTRHLRAILIRHQAHRAVLFTHSRDTALSTWKRLLPHTRVALLTGAGARIASGRIPRDEVLRQFRPHTTADSRAMRIEVLVATDLLSEGVNLHDAAVVIHLDLPWTTARLQQRTGRLRRVSATHETIHEYGLAPLRHADRLLRLTRRLQRKAGLSQTLIGDDPLQLTLPSLLRFAGRATPTSPLESAELMRQRTNTWIHTDLPRTNEPLVIGIRITPDVSPPVAEQTPPSMTLRLLAVVDAGDGAELIASHASGITQDPEYLLRACHILDGGTEFPLSETARRHAIAVASRWTEQEHLRRSSLVTGTSETHRAVLRTLRRTLRHGSREQRSMTARTIATVSDLLSRSVGAGIERALRDWLSSPGDPAAREPAAQEHALLDLLQSRARSAPSHTPPCVLALVSFR